MTDSSSSHESDSESDSKSPLVLGSSLLSEISGDGEHDRDPESDYKAPSDNRSSDTTETQVKSR